MTAVEFIEPLTHEEGVSQATKLFVDTYGAAPEGVWAAPGRVNLIGEHTDYNAGLCLPIALPHRTFIALKPREDTKVRVVSDVAPDKVAEADLDGLKARGVDGWSAYPTGVAWALREAGFDKVKGFDAAFVSCVPLGSGLSSSAAYEVLIGTMLNELFWAGHCTPVELAQIGQYAENVFFGKPCGLMDQMASSVGGVVSIDFENTAHPAVEQLDVDLHAYGYALCILDSGAGHEDLTNEYSAITNELRAVCRVFDKEVLREVPEEAFLAELPKVRAAAGDRAVNRAFHVYAENRRALAEKEALRQGDFDKFLALVRESGRSSAMYLQNVIPTGSTAAQELMVTIALCERILEGRGAVRVHGGGFGGTAQAFVPLDMLDTFKKATEAALGKDCCHVVMIRPAGGVRLG